jgi:hypothetical protein
MKLLNAFFGQYTSSKFLPFPAGKGHNQNNKMRDDNLPLGNKKLSMTMPEVILEKTKQKNPACSLHFYLVEIVFAGCLAMNVPFPQIALLPPGNTHFVNCPWREWLNAKREINCLCFPFPFNGHKLIDVFV